ncbi:MAG: SDR family oxidoreductase [Candidatus Latescibacterota bacterium]|nr:SDR family oxidoreductase [Candidatus Latescibacterota bacterium]
MKRALILGARSDIAVALSEQLAAQGCDVILAARRSDSLEPIASDLRLRHERQVDLLEFDARDLHSHADLAERARKTAKGDFDVVICVFGYLGDQQLGRRDTKEMATTLEVNFTAAAICVSHLANDLEARNTGGIIGISSVAGDRGRQSNYLYGAAKGGFSLFLQGLRNRLHGTGVHVLTVKPGFVDTRMIEGRDDIVLAAPPERVATDILRAYRARRDVLYTPWFWRWILLVVRLLPESIFKRLRL